MRRNELFPKKKAKSRPIQPKISGFLSRFSEQTGIEITNVICNTSENNTAHEAAPKRRKMSEDVELTLTHRQLGKSTAVIKPCNSQDVWQERDTFKKENALTPITFNTNGSNKTSMSSKNGHSPLKKGTSNFDLKENIIVDLTEENTDSDNVKSVINNVALDKCSPIEAQSNGVQNKDELNSNMFHEIVDLDNLLACNDMNELFDTDFFDNEINFSSVQRCKIIDVIEEHSCMSLTVTDLEFKTKSCTIVCSGFWKDTKVKKNDIVAVEAQKVDNVWVVDNNKGYIIIHPDVLISGTTVVGALFCARKAVLVEKFKKIESLPHFRGNQTAMTVGCLVHQLLQKAITEDIRQLSDVTKLMDCILQSKETINMLYASDVSFDKCKQEMLLYVPRVFEFIQHYLKCNKQKSIAEIKGNFKGEITDIRDIEENIWLPNLGMKGKVDVTVEVNVNSRRKIVPLEMKSGRPSFSSEHKGQIILYIMMMSLTGQNTDTGLLLYLRENSMQEITSRHHEKRDLILLRNVVAKYLASNKPSEAAEVCSTPETQWQTLDLPEPINHSFACSTCSYNTLCCAYLSKDKIQLSDGHPLTKLSKQILEKFKSSHIDYILRWVSLLQMEEAAQDSDIPVSRLWTLSPENRESKKTCISYLKILGKVTEYNSKYRHVLVRSDANAQVANTEIPCTEFSENEYVLLSTSTRVNISAGFIANISKTSVVIMLDRDITKYSIKEALHVDKYSSSSLFSFNLANVGGLMGDNEVCARLRDIIIDRKPARFNQGISSTVISKNSEALHRLNKCQQRAVLKVLAASDYVLIKGMPGTGKTQTLITLIELLYESGNTVLITSHTNSAVDNILLKLLEKRIDFLRLGMSSIHPSLKNNSEKFLTAECTTLESLEEVYSKKIVGVTCYGSHHPLLYKRTFDVCVVDESAQTMQPTVLRPLYSAKKFVLVGDPDQLPPIVKSTRARKLGADESLFARLDSENNTVLLTEQYRMNKYIMDLANKLTYNDKLKAGNESTENSTFLAPNSQILTKQKRWLQRVLSQNIIDSVILVNTGSTNALKVSETVSDKYKESDQTCSNIWEAALVSKIVQTLLEMGVTASSMGIIAPYKAHVNLLKKIIVTNVEINTVDQYQGRDKKIIIYSCARSLIKSINVNGDLEVLGDQRRLTVAITRAKSKLILIGDKCTLLQYSAFKKLFELIPDNNTINLNDQREDFSWESVVSVL